MDCKTFQQYLEQRADGALREERRAAAERHLAGCARCRELDALVRGELEVFPVEPPEDLTRGVLERTTGSACTRARGLLCDRVDGTLPAFDTALVEQHLESCSGCRAVESALVRLADDLPAMAHLAPDARFVDAVLSRTLPWAERLNRRLWALGQRWQRLLERPRFGLEAGYVGALVVWVVFGAAVPDRARAVLQAPAVGFERTTEAVNDLGDQLGELSRQTWQVSSRSGSETIESLTTGVARRYERTAEARGTLSRHGSQLGDAALKLDLVESVRAARGLSAGLGSLLRQMQGEETDPSEPDPVTDNPSDDTREHDDAR